MSRLDDTRAIEAADPGGMHAHLVGFAEQLESARAIGRDAPLSVRADGVTAVAVLGMGGSAIGGELLAAYAQDKLRVPLLVNRSYELPAFIGPETLVFVCSYSGNTEETLAAFEDALGRGARIVCSTTGGRVGALAAERGLDVIRIPAGLPPRAALGYSFVPLLVALGRLGFLEDAEGELPDATAVAREAASRLSGDVPAERNAAKELSLWLEGRVPVVYGSVGRTAAIASRWCGQFSENSKLVAHRNELPEMNHNEIVGWSAPGVLGRSARVVFLTDDEDHPRVARRMEVTAGMIEETGVAVRTLRGSGATRLGRMFSLVVLGDFTSFYLSMLSGVDPTPVDPIDRLKSTLARS